MIFEAINLEIESINERQESIITDLLKSHSERENILIIEENQLLKIIESTIFGRQAKTQANEILEILKEIKYIKSEIGFHFEIDFSKEDDSIEYNRELKKFRSGYLFMEKCKTAEPELLVENEDDYNFYMLISEHYAKFLRKINLDIKLSFRLGAGGNIGKEFKRLERNGKIFICISDMDKKHPKGASGSTPTQVKKHQEISKLPCKSIIINHKEAENLLPLPIIFEYIRSCKNEKNNAAMTIKNLTISCEKTHRYFDLKDGYKVGKLIDLDKNHGPFWTPIIEKIIAENPTDCAKDCKGCNNCYNIEGLGKNILKETVNYMKGMEDPIKYIDTNLTDSEVKSEWIRIASELLSWGCVLPFPKSRT